MIARIIEILSGFIVATISAMGYSGVILLMAIESACIPLPSEIIMPFSGYLVSTGQLNLWAVAVAGAVGCVLGSLVAYWVGMYGGRPVIEKYGRYVLLSRHDESKTLYPLYVRGFVALVPGPGICRTKAR